MKNSQRKKIQAKTSKKTRTSSGRIQKSQSTHNRPKQSLKPHQQDSQLRPTLPFSAADNVLLVGEGDFSFANSVFAEHRKHFRFLCATCYDSREELLEKYPQAANTIDGLTNPTEELPVIAPEDRSTDANDISRLEDGDDTSSETAAEDDSTGKETRSTCSVFYSVDATALQKYKPLRRQKWDRILFNFPHVGGKSTDINRQVRYNQALVHSFMKSCRSLLSRPDGTILITLFEGEPYELWNIRDLARSAGLKVVRSFKFQAELYPGYTHARTIGNIRAKGVSEDIASGVKSGEIHEAGDETATVTDEIRSETRPGKWRGEERKARTFEFGLIPEEKPRHRASSNKSKSDRGSRGSHGAGSDDED